MGAHGSSQHRTITASSAGSLRQRTTFKSSQGSNFPLVSRCSRTAQEQLAVGKQVLKVKGHCMRRRTAPAGIMLPLLATTSMRRSGLRMAAIFWILSFLLPGSVHAVSWRVFGVKEECVSVAPPLLCDTVAEHSRYMYVTKYQIASATVPVQVIYLLASVYDVHCGSVCAHCPAQWCCTMVAVVHPAQRLYSGLHSSRWSDCCTRCACRPRWKGSVDGPN